jgi:3-oxoacyl-[acyl-carrier-protein] synthase-3
MRPTNVADVKIAAIACAVPQRRVSYRDDAIEFGEAEMEKIASTTGIRERRVACRGVTTSDLCIAAAEKLFETGRWQKESIEAVIVVTQSPDYFLPATACTVQSRLGLPTECAAFDVNLGCSGYTYALWFAGHLISGGAASKVLLLVGDVANKVHPKDRSARPLFGDAGSATIVEASPGAPRTFFRVGTDGAGQNHLIVPAGVGRLPHNPRTALEMEGEDGNIRSLDNLHMNGAEVFIFTLSKLPSLLKATMADAGWTIDDVDAVVLHQANSFMLKHVAKSAKIPLEKIPLSLDSFGNTSSASIPITIVSRMRELLAGEPRRLLLAGWGVGWSWAAAAIQLHDTYVADLVEVDCEALLRSMCDVESDAESHLSAAVRKELSDAR